MGESDSPGWASTKTDMVFIKMDTTDQSIAFASYLGGSGEDQALVVLGNPSDNFLYALGQGYSVEYTFGTIDLFIVRFSQDGTLDYMVSFGGKNPDFGADLKLFGSRLIISGHS